MITFTKEQLISSAHARIEFAEMMLSGELEPLKERTWSIELELARIALASLEAEPVAWLYSASFERGHVEGELTDAPGCDMPVYTSPPAPVSVPTFDEWLEIRGNKPLGWVKDAMRESYDACRAAMLQGADGNSPVIPDGLNIRAVAALREAVRNQWLKSDDFADRVYWKSMHDIANEIVSAMLAAAPRQEVK